MGVLLILHMFPKLASGNFFLSFFFFFAYFVDVTNSFSLSSHHCFRFSGKWLSFTSALRLLGQRFKCYLQEKSNLACALLLGRFPLVSSVGGWCLPTRSLWLRAQQAQAGLNGVVREPIHIPGTLNNTFFLSKSCWVSPRDSIISDSPNGLQRTVIKELEIPVLRDWKVVAETRLLISF